jgi:hypothetical protein
MSAEKLNEGAVGRGGESVRIHIDRIPYESPNPTTSAALYRLGRVRPGWKLFREVRGDHEDPPIEDGPEPVHLRPDEHFHSGESRSVTIIVEGTPHKWRKPSITYVEVVTLFDPAFPQHPDVTYSVTYDRGPSLRHEGILSPGASVKVKEGMVFNVSRTGQS